MSYTHCLVYIRVGPDSNFDCCSGQTVALRLKFHYLFLVLFLEVIYIAVEEILCHVKFTLDPWKNQCGHALQPLMLA